MSERSTLTGPVGWKAEIAREQTGGWCCDLAAATNARIHRDDCDGVPDYVAPGSTTTMTRPPLAGETTHS